MMPALSYYSGRGSNHHTSASTFSQQWANPSDVFSVLLILGGDVVASALAQLAGSRITPVAFSFGKCLGPLPCNYFLTLFPGSRVGGLRGNRRCQRHWQQQTDARRRLLLQGHQWRQRLCSR